MPIDLLRMRRRKGNKYMLRERRRRVSKGEERTKVGKGCYKYFPPAKQAEDVDKLLEITLGRREGREKEEMEKSDGSMFTMCF